MTEYIYHLRAVTVLHYLVCFQVELSIFEECVWNDAGIYRSCFPEFLSLDQAKIFINKSDILVSICGDACQAA